MASKRTLKSNASVTLTQLRAKTALYVRMASNSTIPILITDRGRSVAVLAPISMSNPVALRRINKLLPEFAEWIQRPTRGDFTQSDLDAIRGDR